MKVGVLRPTEKKHKHIKLFHSSVRPFSSPRDSVETAIVCVLEPGAALAFKGGLEFIVLQGKLEILGSLHVPSAVDNNQQWISAFSSDAVGPLLYFTNAHLPIVEVKANSGLSLRSTIGLRSDVVDQCLAEASCDDAVFVIRPTASVNNFCSFLNNLSGCYPLLSLSTEFKLHAFHDASQISWLDKLFLLDTNESLPLFHPPAEVDSLAGNIDVSLDDHSKTAVVFVTGAQHSGKSVFCRFLLNRLLANHPIIYYLDTDVGQCEFSLAGSVSLVAVSSAILGPPFCQLKHFENPNCCWSYFVGDIHLSEKPDTFLRSVSLLLKQFHAIASAGSVLIVNGNGWVQGFGSFLINKLLQIICPDFIAHMRTSKSERFSQLLQGYCSDQCGVNSCSLIEVDSNFDNNEPSLSSKDKRDLSVLSYFSQCLATPYAAFNTAKPYVINWTDISIAMCFDEDTGSFVQDTFIMASINSVLVGLCIVNDVDDTSGRFCNNELFPLKVKPNTPLLCRGYGIIRAIDMEKRFLYVLSPLSENEMQSINCIAKGNLELPESILTTQLNHRLTDCAYVMHKTAHNCWNVRGKERPSVLGLRKATRLKTKRMKRKRKPEKEL